MTECQRKAQMKKIRNYEQQAREALKLQQEQARRVKYFQGLINQLREVLKEE